MDFKAIFKPISVILQANFIFFFCHFQEVEGSIPAAWGSNILSWVILSLPLIQEGQLSVSGKRMCTVLVNY